MSSKTDTVKASVLKSVDMTQVPGVELKQKKPVNPDDLPTISKKGQEFVNRLGNVSSAYAARLAHRKRPRWHQYWASPGEDYERCMTSGVYTQVREPTEQQRRDGYEPGTESGEVRKILTSEGKVELIELECPLDAYVEYLNWMSQESTRQHTIVKENFYRNIEDLNSQFGGRGREITAGEVDNNGDFKPL